MSDRGDEEESGASSAAEHKPPEDFIPSECDVNVLADTSEPTAGAAVEASDLPKWPSRGELSETHYEHLASELKSNPELKELDLRRNTLNESGVELLCAALESPTCRLQTLRLRGSIVSERCCASLASALKSDPSHLRELDLSEIKNLTDSGVKLLATGLESPRCRLRTLRLADCKLSESSCVSLLSALQSNPSYLKELDLSGNSVEDSGVELVCAVLKNPLCTLHTLRLCSCGLTENSCDSLASALKSRYIYFHELDLSQNQLQDTGIMLLSDGLKSPRCRLNTLRLRSCLLSDSGCIALVSALESQLPHLMEVDLSGNELQEKGKRVLLELVKRPDCRMRSLRVEDGQELVKRVHYADYQAAVAAKRLKTSETVETESFMLPEPSDVSTVDDRGLPIRLYDYMSSPYVGERLKARTPSSPSHPELSLESYTFGFHSGFSLDPNRTTPEVYSTVDQRLPMNTPTLFSPEVLNERRRTSYRSSLILQGSPKARKYSAPVGRRLEAWSPPWSSRPRGVPRDPNRTKPEVYSTVDQVHQINTPTLFSPELFNERGRTSYRFRSWSAGVFQCELTRLVFKMTRGGELMYWIIQWDEDLLKSAGKTPAGPLFSISCSGGSVSQLHLPHCGLPGLSVVHISDDGMSILQPLEITDSHMVVDVPHLSAFGLVWDIIKRLLNIQIPVCGQVLLFYQPRYKNQSQKLNVFLLPENVPVQEVKCQQKMAEYIAAPSSCLLTTGRFYSLLCPEAARIQPEHALFDLKYGPNYHPTFEIRMTPNTEEVTVRVRDQEERHVWQYHAELPGGASSSAPGPSSQVTHTITSDSASSLHGLVTEEVVQAAPAFSLSSAQPPSTEPGSSSLVPGPFCHLRGGASSSAPGPSSLFTHTITSDSASSLHGLVTDGGLDRQAIGPHLSYYNVNWQPSPHVQEDQKLNSVRAEFIKRVSGPVLKNLLDELLQKGVINSSELEEMQVMSREDKARELIDIVVNKGPVACKIMIDAFREIDPFVFGTLKLH